MSQVTRHWRARVRKRIGPDMDPDLLWQALDRAIAYGSDRVRYLGRLNRCGKRAWAFTLTGREFIVIAHDKRPVTLLTPEMFRRMQ